MATEKLADAIVRGPMPYFGKDGVLYMPGQEVRGVPAEDVSEDDTREVEAEFEARNGELRKRDVPKPIVFRPVDGDEPTIAGPTTTADVATGNPDRLNVTDFLKQGDEEVIAAIVSGSVDSHIGVIEQAVITGKGKARSDVRDAISARMSTMSPVR